MAVVFQARSAHKLWLVAILSLGELSVCRSSTKEEEDTTNDMRALTGLLVSTFSHLIKTHLLALSGRRQAQNTESTDHGQLLTDSAESSNPCQLCVLVHEGPSPVLGMEAKKSGKWHCQADGDLFPRNPDEVREPSYDLAKWIKRYIWTFLNRLDIRTYPPVFFSTNRMIQSQVRIFSYLFCIPICHNSVLYRRRSEGPASRAKPVTSGGNTRRNR